MIVVIDKANRRLFTHQMEQLSLLRQGERSQVFEGAWAHSLSGNAVNLAEDGSVYIADLDQSHTVRAALRLTPTCGASLLRDQFSRELAPPVPRNIPKSTRSRIGYRLTSKPRRVLRNATASSSVPCSITAGTRASPTSIFSAIWNCCHSYWILSGP